MESQLRSIYYTTIIIAFFLSLICKNKRGYGVMLIGGLLIAILCYNIGTRDINVGVDTLTYRYIFDSVEGLSFSLWLNSLSILGTEPIFKALMILGHQIGDFQDTLCIISALTLSLSFLFSIRLSRLIGDNNPVAIFCCYLASFYCFGQQYNIIRAGLSAPLLLNFYLSIYQKKKISTFIYGILALGVHFSSLIPIALALIAFFWDFSVKKALLMFFGSMFLSYIGIGALNIGFLVNMDNDKVQAYVGGQNTTYKVGFRAGFALFNTIVYFLSIWLSHKNIRSAFFEFLLRLFVLSSSLFFLWFLIPYSDRIGAFSWNLMPFMIYIALWYRIPKKKLARVLSFAILYSMNLGISLIS